MWVVHWVFLRILRCIFISFSFSSGLLILQFLKEFHKLCLIFLRFEKMWRILCSNEFHVVFIIATEVWFGRRIHLRCLSCTSTKFVSFTRTKFFHLTHFFTLDFKIHETRNKNNDKYDCCNCYWYYNDEVTWFPKVLFYNLNLSKMIKLKFDLHMILVVTVLFYMTIFSSSIGIESF